MSALLRPDVRRGELVAAGAVALAIAVGLLDFRFEEKWEEAVHFVYTALAATVAINLAAMSSRVSAGPPPRWHSVLFVVSFVLVLLALDSLASLLGSEDGVNSSGAAVWAGSLLIALVAWFSIRFDSGISTLLAAVTFVFVLIAFVDWVFSLESGATFRWVLLAGALALAAFSVAGEKRGPHHAVGYVNAAGIALLGIAVVFAIDAFESIFSGGDLGLDVDTGWELVFLIGGFALLSYSVWARQNGPAYLGALNLFAFVLLAYPAGEDGPSLIGWPIVILLVAVGLLAAALRPGSPSPGRRSIGGPPPA